MMNLSSQIEATPTRVFRSDRPVTESMLSLNAADHHEVVEDAPRARAVFRALASSQSRGFIRSTEGEPFRFSIEGFDEDACELICNFDETIDLPPSFLLEVEGYASMYWIAVTSSYGPLFARHCRVQIAVVRVGHRHGLRGPADGIEVRFHHPTYGYPVQRRARDVSKRGLSFWLLPSDDIATVGMRLERLEIVRNGEVVVSCAAEIRSIMNDSHQGAACGVRVDAASLSDLSAWADLIDPVLHPSTVARASDAHALWRLYEASGYMHLSGCTESDFEHLKKTFASASERLSRAPQLGCQVVFPAHDIQRPQATASMFKTHTHTWLGYQMAKLPGRVIGGVTRREMLRRTLMHAYEHASSDPNLRWLVVYVQEGTRFSEMAIKDFATRHALEESSAVVRCRAMRTSTVPVPQTDASDGVHVCPGSYSDVTALHQHVVENFPKAYVEALDLTPEKFWINDLREECVGAGLERERTLLVAKDGNQGVAVAVLELASEGLHLFGLLDSVRIYSMPNCTEGALNELVAACRQWYRARGRDKFVLFREGDDMSLLENFEDMGFANQTITSATLLGELLEHLFEVTAPSLRPGALG